MSPISLGLDLLLVVLLLSALAVGLRLNRQLKQLRAGQAGFVRAVSELDAAAARAESGLKALRAASEDAHDELLARIETARGLITRLETATAHAARAAEALPPPPAPRKPAAPRPAAAPRAIAEPRAPEPRVPEPRLPESRFRGPVEVPAAAPRAPAPAPAPAARPDLRARLAPRAPVREVDADLFEADPDEGLGMLRRGLGAGR